VDTFANRMRNFAALAAGLTPTWWSDKHNKVRYNWSGFVCRVGGLSLLFSCDEFGCSRLIRVFCLFLLVTASRPDQRARSGRRYCYRSFSLYGKWVVGM
jgi:hypothetical protein